METVYLIDSDSAIRDALTTLLESYDIPVKAYSDSESFFWAVRDVPTGCVLVEAELPGLNGLGLLRKLRDSDSTIPVVLLTSNAEPGFVERAERAGAVGVLEKPFVSDELVHQLQTLAGQNTWAGIALPHASDETLSDGTQITIRPIQLSDRQMEHSFVQSLSPMSKHYRFFGGIAALSDRMLDKFTHTHYPDNVAIIATVMENDTEEEIGVARYATTGESTADCAVAVANAWQGRGVATRLLQRLMTIARQAGVTELVGMVLRDNREMLALACHLGFVIRREEDASIIRVSRRLVRDISGVDDSRHADV